jgi:uncharacterized SAM-dependent methyltransferase
MHLESAHRQLVHVPSLGLELSFAKGERIHTESSRKYDDARVDRLLSGAGLARVKTFRDARRWFGLHLVRPTSP